MSDTSTTGARFVEAMRRTGWSKTRLANVTGLSYATITRMCNGNRAGYVDSWITVCDVMGVSMSEILQGGKDE